MYGTVMLGKLKAGKQQEWLDGLESWKKERNVAGFQSEHVVPLFDGDVQWTDGTWAGGPE